MLWDCVCGGVGGTHAARAHAEDVDAVFVGREAASRRGRRERGGGGVTFSGLLNALDGVAAQVRRRCARRRGRVAHVQ